jgi:hypothetical protein
MLTKQTKIGPYEQVRVNWKTVILTMRLLKAVLPQNFRRRKRDTSCPVFRGSRKSASPNTSFYDLLDISKFLTEWTVVALSCGKVTEEKAGLHNECNQQRTCKG